MKLRPISLSEPQILRFTAKIIRHNASGCWIWSAARNEHGYGMFGIGGRKVALSHRVAWTVHKGEIPEGLFVLHRCDNPACCNPDHLFLGTQKDNLSDCSAKGRISRGEHRHMAKLSESSVVEIVGLHEAGMSQNKIAKQFGVTRSSIQDVVRGVTWKHVTNKMDRI